MLIYLQVVHKMRLYNLWRQSTRRCWVWAFGAKGWKRGGGWG